MFEAIPSLAKRVSAISTEPRLKILRVLFSVHPEWMTNGNIAATTGASEPNVSHHLNNLEKEGLVDQQRVGKCIWRRVNAAKFIELIDDLAKLVRKDFVPTQGVPDASVKGPDPVPAPTPVDLSVR
jgi:DNA-binding transcriptional ArsR family regulator